jgi:ATP-dependent DNA helicase RecG
MEFIENATIEFKREYTDDIKKSIIAFANTNGGTLYIGISDDGAVLGVNDWDKTTLKVSNSIRDTIKPDITLFINCETETIENKKVVKITVQKGTACPYYLADKGIRPEGVYVRQGPASVPATETAIIKMIKETDGEKYEAIRSLNQDLTFVEAEKEFSKRNVLFGVNQFKTLKLMTPDGIYTNLGLLLSDQCIHSIKLAVFEGTDKSVFKDRREFTGSLLKQLNETYDFIDRYNSTRSKFSGLYRTDRRDYPPDAIREALLNAVVHRDYAYSGSTLISIFTDHLEFISIGGLVKGITFADIRLGISVARNENLANVFYRLALIEAYGTGIPKIFPAYEGGSLKPQIETSDNAFKITLSNLNQHPILQEYSPMEQTILSLFQKQDLISRQDVESKLKIGQTAAGRLLKQLVNSGVLERSGTGKNTKYILAKTL